MIKNTLRKTYLQIRKNTDGKVEKSSEIRRRLFENEGFKNAKTLAVYCSLPDEVETDGIIENALAMGKSVVVPKIISPGIMKFYRIMGISQLAPSYHFGIREPDDLCEEVSAKDIQLAVVPGVCFDLSKSRIGQGGGYYDRYLAECDSAIKVGICFDSQILKDSYIPCEKTDIKMDLIITEKEVIS